MRKAANIHLVWRGLEMRLVWVLPMTADAMQFSQHNHTSPLVVIALIVALVIIAGIVYGACEQTIHAQRAHQGQAWTAESIQAYFDAGKCKPTIYACPAGDFEVHYCQVNADKAIGLVIGRTVRQVVTGFMASVGYWGSRCQ